MEGHPRKPAVSILKLVDYSCQDTISVLKVLLTMALSGKLRGLMICYRTDEGVEKTVFTGAYKAHPNKAVGAALRTSMTVMVANGELD